MLQTEDHAPAGTLLRSVSLLRCLAAAGPGGAALTQLSREAGLPHATVHRILRQLQDAGMVCRVPDGRRYALGPVVFELGLAAAAHHDLRDSCGEVIAELATRLRTATYLCIRSGNEAVCVDRADGFKGRVRLLEPGSRRPLGVGAAGLAVLAAMPAPARRAAMAQVASHLEDGWNLTVDDLDEMLRRTHELGYATTSHVVVRGMTAVAVPFHAPTGDPVGAVSVAAPTALMTDRRRESAASQLRGVRALIEAGLARRGR